MSMLSEIWHWLMSPMSGADLHEIEPWTYWHARMMTLAWSVVLPLGMGLARFYKIWPGQDWPRVLDYNLWFRIHWPLQSVGVGVMTIGFLFAYGRGFLSTTAASVHHFLGGVAVAIGWMQVVGALLRGDKGGPTAARLRGDHYDMTPRRVFFEIVHKSLGWIAVPFAVAATFLGLALVDAPRWMPIGIGLWWVALVIAFARMQRNGRCIDTYSAIWGPDPSLPGNRRRPIGWGVRRPPA